jgi:hypothetical protein
VSGIIKCDSCGRKVIGQLIGDTLECPSCGEKISEEEFEVLDEGDHEEKTDEAISLEEKLSDKDEEAPTGDVTDEKIAPKKADGVQMNEANTFLVSAEANRKGICKVTLEADALTLAAVEGGESIQILRADAEEKIVLQESLLGRWLAITIQKERVGVELERSQVALLKEWLGPPTIRGLKVALKKRLNWCLPIGILFVFSSLPLSGDPEAGLEAVPFDAVSAFLGASLIAITILARIWFRRILFLLDGVWLSLLALNVTVNIFRGDSLWWAIIVIVLIHAAKGGFSEYQRFASVPHH